MFRLVALMVVIASPAFAASKGDWFASLYTGDGVELRNDERVFTLFALFNAMGFDQGPVTRKDPVPRVNYHPVRQQVRARVISGDPEVRKVAEAFFDAHAVPLRKYLAYVVSADQPPFATGAKAKDLQELKGLETVLAKAWNGWKLEELMASVQADSRRVLKTYIAGTDAPLQKARKILKVPDAQEAVIVVNLLDTQDAVRGVMGENNEANLVVGPTATDKPNVEGVIREYARLFIEPAVARQVNKWGGGVAVLKEAQAAGAAEQTVQEYAAVTISTALALKSMDAPDAEWEAASSHGYFGIRDVAKLFDDGKPMDSLVIDAMQKIETRRPAKK